MEIQKPISKLQTFTENNSNANRGTYQKSHKSTYSFNYELGIDHNHHIQQPFYNTEKKPPINNGSDDSFCCIY